MNVSKRIIISLCLFLTASLCYADGSTYDIDTANHSVVGAYDGFKVYQTVDSAGNTVNYAVDDTGKSMTLEEGDFTPISTGAVGGGVITGINGVNFRAGSSILQPNASLAVASCIDNGGTVSGNVQSPSVDVLCIGCSITGDTANICYDASTNAIAVTATSGASNSMSDEELASACNAKFEEAKAEDGRITQMLSKKRNQPTGITCVFGDSSGNVVNGFESGPAGESVLTTAQANAARNNQSTGTGNGTNNIAQTGKKIAGTTPVTPANTSVGNEEASDADRRKFIMKLKESLEAWYKGSEVADVDNFKFMGKNQSFSGSKTNPLGRCESLLKSGSSWGDIVKIGQKAKSEASLTTALKPAYVFIYQDLARDIAKSTKKSQVATYISNAMQEAVDMAYEVQRCSALATMMGHVDYTDIKTSSVEGIDSVKKSFDQKIKASKNGVETQDFPACSNAIDLYNAAFLGQTALHMGQDFQFQEASMGSSIKAQENANDITAGLKAQQEMTDEQKKITNARAAFQGAKATTMGIAWGNIPTIESLVTKCNAKMNLDGEAAHPDMDNFIKFIQSSAQHAWPKIGIASDTGGNESPNKPNSNSTIFDSSTAESGTSTTAEFKIVVPAIAKSEFQSDQICSHATQGKITLIANEVSCKEKLFKVMMDAGVDMAANLMKSKLLEDQSDMIGDAINNVEKFDEDNPAPTFGEANLELCQADPTAAECAGVDPVFDRGRTFSGNGINIEGFQRASTAARINSERSDDDVASSDSESTGRGAGVKGIGSTINAPTNSTAFVDPSPGAASMKKGGGAGGGGGGGGVGAAKGGGPSGGLGGGGGGRSFGKRRGGKVNYSGGGGSLSLGGGGKGRSRRAGKSGGNPFSTFFKNKKGGKKGKTLTFRGVASVGKKKDTLFGMISSRYDKIKDERLIKYEADKK